MSCWRSYNKIWVQDDRLCCLRSLENDQIYDFSLGCNEKWNKFRHLFCHKLLKIILMTLINKSNIKNNNKKKQSQTIKWHINSLLLSDFVFCDLSVKQTQLVFLTKVHLKVWVSRWAETTAPSSGQIVYRPQHKQQQTCSGVLNNNMTFNLKAFYFPAVWGTLNSTVI